MQNATSKPIITIKEARKRLGKDAKHLTDIQVQYIIDTLQVIAREYLSNTGSKN